MGRALPVAGFAGADCCRFSCFVALRHCYKVLVLPGHACCALLSGVVSSADVGLPTQLGAQSLPGPCRPTVLAARVGDGSPASCFKAVEGCRPLPVRFSNQRDSARAACVLAICKHEWIVTRYKHITWMLGYVCGCQGIVLLSFECIWLLVHGPLCCDALHTCRMAQSGQKLFMPGCAAHVLHACASTAVDLPVLSDASCSKVYVLQDAANPLPLCAWPCMLSWAVLLAAALLLQRCTSLVQYGTAWQVTCVRLCGKL